MWNSRVGMEREESNERRGGDLLSKEVVKEGILCEIFRCNKYEENWNQLGKNWRGYYHYFFLYNKINPGWRLYKQDVLSLEIRFDFYYQVCVSSSFWTSKGFIFRQSSHVQFAHSIYDFLFFLCRLQFLERSLSILYSSPFHLVVLFLGSSNIREGRLHASGKCKFFILFQQFFEKRVQYLNEANVLFIFVKI